MNLCKMRLISWGLGLLTGAGAGVGAERPTVVELFTSQGCSSCPPADALLGELAKRPDILALAFHVDYWDDTGWRDGFELPISTQRQDRYVRQLGLSMAATPQMIVDGSGEILGTNRERVAALLKAPHASVPVRLERDGEFLTVRLDAAAEVPKSDVLLVGYRLEASTAVSGGENRGRVLKDFNIVRCYRSLGTWSGSPARWRVALKEIPMDASRVAVLVQRTPQREFIGAASVAVRDDTTSTSMTAPSATIN